MAETKTIARCALAAAIGATACAHAPAPPPAGPTDRGPTLLTSPGPLAEGWLLPSRVLDGTTGLPVDEEALYASLLGSRVIYVAERHDSPHDHAVQLRIIDGLRQRDASLGIAMEMFKRPFQKWVTDYVSGKIDETTLLAKTQWEERWGFDFALYRPILEYARTHGIPVYAINARDEITRKVAAGGLESLDPVDRETIPDLDLADEAHRRYVEEAFSAHGPHGTHAKDDDEGARAHGSMRFENFYAAQVIWDETMAYEVARTLREVGAPARLIVLAGGGHIRRRLGIPKRAARRGAEPYAIVLPVIAAEGAETAADLLEERAGDYLWMMADDERGLP